MIKLACRYFCENEPIIKFKWKHKGYRIAKTILTEQKNQTTWLQDLRKVTVIMIVKNWQKDNQIILETEKSRNRPTHTQSMIYDKDAKTIQ